MLEKYIDTHVRDVKNFVQDKNLIKNWEEAYDLCLSALSQGSKLLIAGNGGSAADAQHFAAEIVGRFSKERKGYPAIALSTDTSILTAIGNDYNFSQIFSRQIEALATKGDCFIGISTSGNSENIVTALQKAREKEVKTVLLTGRGGGTATNLADVSIIVPAQETSHIQELHQILYHAWCAQLDEKLGI